MYLLNDDIIDPATQRWDFPPDRDPSDLDRWLLSKGRRFPRLSSHLSIPEQRPNPSPPALPLLVVIHEWHVMAFRMLERADVQSGCPPESSRAETHLRMFCVKCKMEHIRNSQFIRQEAERLQGQSDTLLSIRPPIPSRPASQSLCLVLDGVERKTLCCFA